MDNDPALPQAQACGTTDPGSDKPIRFAPVQSLRPAPRLWDRKPSTPFRAGLKSRKVWKRFRSSFTSMKALRQSTATENDPLQTAINASKDSEYVRGVKRLCLGSGAPENRIEQRERSFLETKWESEAFRKRRKLPDVAFDIYDENLNWQDMPASPASRSDSTLDDVCGNRTGDDLDEFKRASAGSASPLPLSTLHGPSKTAGYSGALDVENLNPTRPDTKATDDMQSRRPDQEPRTMIDDAGGDERNDMASASAAALQLLTQEQEGTLVRSALRSSLDGDDAVLLNDFLSRAKAKRAAKAALANVQDAEAVERSSSSESPETEDPTPRSRRALEDRDANSPSPVKVQGSPCKSDAASDAKAHEELVHKAQDNEPAPPSPACRRSTRTRASASNAAPVRNAISLRRAKGTEFVFLQRTEAQELALATKRNTRHNKGNAVLPKFALEALAQPSSEEDATTDTNGRGRSDRKGPSSRRPAGSRKQVSWNEERLVEFEDERQAVDDPEEEEGDTGQNDVGRASRLRPTATRSGTRAASSSSRSSRSQGLQKADRDADSEGADGGPTARTTTPATAPTTAAPPSRRVRRLGDSGSMGSGTPVKTGTDRGTSKSAAGSAASSVAGAGSSTPTKGRRKLTPKSPRSSLLPAPSSKSANLATDQQFVSGIPTRSAKSSEGTKRKSTLQVGAGSTPMPRRVRTRT